MKRYLVLAKSTIMQIAVYRANLFFDLALNIFYLFLWYYFWKAVYFKGGIINGMTFQQTFVYIVFASLIMASINTGMERGIAEKIFSGNIVYDLARPLNFHLRELFENMGAVAFKFLYFTIPLVTIFLVFFPTNIKLGINIPMFFIALIFSFLINFLISFIVGLLGFYTQSVWGVSVFKNFMVSLLSGAVIPLPFFPGIFKKIAFILPFHTIINTPMKLFTANEITYTVAFNSLVQQVLWASALLIISILLFKRLINHLIVNGG